MLELSRRLLSRTSFGLALKDTDTKKTRSQKKALKTIRVLKTQTEEAGGTTAIKEIHDDYVLVEVFLQGASMDIKVFHLTPLQSLTHFLSNSIEVLISWPLSSNLFGLRPLWARIFRTT